MGKTFQCASGETNVWAFSTAEVAYSPLCMNYGDDGFSSAEENQTQVPYRGECVLGGLSVVVSANTFTTAALTVRTRKNGANVNQVVSVTAGSTGIFSDIVNVDELVDGDTYNSQVTADAGGSGTAQLRSISIWQRATQNHRVQYGVANDGLVSFVASTTYFCHVAGDIGLETVENSVKAQIDIAGTLKNLQVGVSVNGRSTSTVVTVRKNNGNGNQTITIPASTTGFFEDVTNTDSIAVGDDINYTIIMGTGTGTFGVRIITSTFETTTNNANNIYSSTALGRSRIAADTNNSNIAGMIQVNSLTEATTNQNTNFDFSVASNLKCYISANTNTGASTLRLRKNAANANQVVTITASTTGLFEDVSNTDVIAEDDDVNYQWTGGTTLTSVCHWMGMFAVAKPIERISVNFI